jgi:hypothetical protein
MDHGKLATGRRLGWSSTVVGMASDDALSPRTPSAVTVYTGDPPPSNESTWEYSARRLDGSVVARQWRLVFDQICMG